MLKNSVRSYSYDIKAQAVEMFLEGHPMKDILAKYEIKNSRRVYEWVEKVKENGYKALNDQRGKKSKGKTKTESETYKEAYERKCIENDLLKKLINLERG